MRKLNKKRRGSVLVVTALILLIFPSVLILANLGINGVKLTKRNLDYHQEILVRESLEVVLEETITSVLLEDIDIEVDRDSYVIGGITFYYDYYIPRNEEIDLDSVFTQMLGRSGLYTKLDIDTIVIEEVDYESNITPSGEEFTPYSSVLPIKFKMIVDKNNKVITYSVNVNVQYTVETDINTEKGYISAAEVTEINIVE